MMQCVAAAVLLLYCAAPASGLLRWADARGSTPGPYYGELRSAKDDLTLPELRRNPRSVEESIFSPARTLPKWPDGVPFYISPTKSSHRLKITVAEAAAAEKLEQELDEAENSVEEPKDYMKVYKDCEEGNVEEGDDGHKYIKMPGGEVSCEKLMEKINKMMDKPESEGGWAPPSSEKKSQTQTDGNKAKAPQGVPFHGPRPQYKLSPDKYTEGDHAADDRDEEQVAKEKASRDAEKLSRQKQVPETAQERQKRMERESQQQKRMERESQQQKRMERESDAEKQSRPVPPPTGTEPRTNNKGQNPSDYSQGDHAVPDSTKRIRKIKEDRQVESIPQDEQIQEEPSSKRSFRDPVPSAKQQPEEVEPQSDIKPETKQDSKADTRSKAPPATWDEIVNFRPRVPGQVYPVNPSLLYNRKNRAQGLPNDPTNPAMSKENLEQHKRWQGMASKPLSARAQVRVKVESPRDLMNNPAADPPGKLPANAAGVRPTPVPAEQ